MKRFISFLKSTTWISRILFCLFVFFSIFAKFSNETRLKIIIEFGALFLIPALLVEMLKNPILKSVEEKDGTLWASLQRFFLSFRWIYILMVAMWIYGAFFSSFSKSDGILFASIIYGILFILPIAVIEICVRVKNKGPKPKKETVKSDKYISPRRIAGIIVLAFAVLFVFIGISANKNPATFNSNNMYPGYTFGAIGVALLLFSVRDPKTKTEYFNRKKEKDAMKEARLKQLKYEKRMRAYKGIYLTEQQIIQLENRVELPIVDAPVFLGVDEVAVYYSVATRQEIKNRVVGRTGGYAGGTIRIAKGFSIHAGGSSGRPVYGNVSTHYEGKLVLTNKRLVFLSEQKGFELPYHSITAATAHPDGLSIQSRSHTYTLLLPKAELATIAFDAVRTGEIPLSGNDLNIDYSDNEFDEMLIEEADKSDVSFVDGMDGHDFEYFCAELLKKHGFSEVSVTKGSGDQGVDVLATKDGIKYAIQCKNYFSPLGNTPVQEVNAGKIFYNCHVGVVMTNSTFTQGAVDLAKATGTLLWDREYIQELMK